MVGYSHNRESIIPCVSVSSPPLFYILLFQSAGVTTGSHEFPTWQFWRRGSDDVEFLLGEVNPAFSLDLSLGSPANACPNQNMDTYYSNGLKSSLLRRMKKTIKYIYLYCGPLLESVIHLFFYCLICNQNKFLQF